jgi:hypothetical protein
MLGTCNRGRRSEYREQYQRPEQEPNEEFKHGEKNIPPHCHLTTVVDRRYRNFAPFVRQTRERKAQTCAKAI